LAIFSLKLFLAIFFFEKENFATEYSFFKIKSKKEREREKARRLFYFILFFGLRAFAEKLENSGKLIFKM
jgi:hypothetical protein